MFIGSNFVFHMLKKYPDYRIICLDKLTYAGNLSTLAPVMDQPYLRLACDHFPEKLIPLMIANALADKPLPVYGEGLNIRDWLYVENHCKELGKPESLITHVGDRKGHDMRYAIDPTKIHNELGWLPETKFEDGIKKTIQWYLDNREWWETIISGEYQNYYEKMYSNR